MSFDRPARLKLLLEQAKQHGTQHPQLWWEAAQLQAQFRAIGQAKIALRKASSLASSHDWPFLLQIADSAKQLGDQPLAISLYQRALSNPGSHGGANLALADSYERMNRLGEASAELEKIPAALRAEPPALLLKAKLQRRQGHHEAALEVIRKLLRTHPTLFPAWEIAAYHEQFVTLDSLARFEEAYASLCHSKKLNLALAGHERIEKMQQAKKQSYQRLLAIVRQLDDSTIERWKASMPSSRKPAPAFLIGHPRSGTTLLENILESHSHLVSSDELPAFQFNAIDPITANFRPPAGSEEEAQQAFLAYLDELPLKNLLGYRSAYLKEMETLLERPLRGHLLLDKNPAITDGALFALRIFPHAKFLFAQRDPRAVVWSAFTLPMLDTSWIGSFWFDLKTTAEAYAMITDLWLEFRAKLPVSQSHTIRYESLVADPRQEGQRATTLLGLEWESAQEHFHAHARQKQVRSPTYADVVKPVYTKALEHWRNYEAYLEPALPHLQSHLDRFGYPL